MARPDTRRQDLKTLALASLTLIFTTLCWAPAQIFLSNGGEVTVSLGQVIARAWPLPLTLAFITVLVGAVGSDTIRRATACQFLAIAVLLYLQGNLLVRDYGIFDGSEVDWDRHRLAGVIEIFVWLGLLGGALIFRHRCWPRIPMIAAVTIVLQVGGLGFQLAGGGSLTPRTAGTEIEDLFAFSPESNVLVILLDGFPSPTFDQMLARDPALAAQLDGFTYFRNTAAVSPYTLLSIPTILAGRVYDNSQTVQDFMSTSFGEDSLPRVLGRHGYQPQIATAGLYDRQFAGIPYQVADSLVDEDTPTVHQRDALKIWDVTLFRYAPHFLKQVIYRDHTWLLQRTLLPDSNPPTKSAIRIDRMATTEAQKASGRLWSRAWTEMNADSDAPTFKFLHFFTSHPPYLLDTQGIPLSRVQYEERILYERCLDQGEYTMDQTLRLLARLRELAVLEDALVVIAADHGSSAGQRGLSVPINRGLPLLLVKPPHAAGPLRTDATPASLLDIPATITAVLDVPADYPGWKLLNNPPAGARNRPYFYFTWEKRFWRTEYLPELTKYTVSGPAWERSSWVEGPIIPAASRWSD